MRSRSGLVLKWIGVLKHLKEDLSEIENSNGKYALKERVKLALILLGGCIAFTACALSLFILTTTTIERNFLKKFATQVEEATGMALSQKNMEGIQYLDGKNKQINYERDKNPRIYNRIFNKSVIVNQHANQIEELVETKEARIFLMARYLDTGFQNRKKDDKNGDITWFPEKNLTEKSATEEEKLLVASALLVRMGINNIIKLQNGIPQSIEIPGIEADNYQAEISQWMNVWPENSQVIQMLPDGKLLLKYSRDLPKGQDTVDMMVSLWN